MMDIFVLRVIPDLLDCKNLIQAGMRIKVVELAARKNQQGQ